MAIKKLKVVVKRPAEKPLVMEIDNTLEAQQKLVGGLIEVIPSYPFGDYHFIINEEGKLQELSPNIQYGQHDFIAGTLIVTKADHIMGEFLSLSDDETRHIIKGLEIMSIQ